MKAACHTFHDNLKQMRGKNLQFLHNNSTKVTYINKHTPKSEPPHPQTCDASTFNRITVTVSRLVSERNVVEDLISGQGQVCNNESSIDAATFSCIQTRNMFGPATFD